MIYCIHNGFGPVVPRILMHTLFSQSPNLKWGEQPKWADASTRRDAFKSIQPCRQLFSGQTHHTAQTSVSISTHHWRQMDSPLLPTIRGGPRDLDDTFADMSLASARSPDAAAQARQPPSSSSSSTQPPRRSVFGRPAPTRIFDDTDTPEAPPRVISSEARKGGGGGGKPRQSIFPGLGSNSARSGGGGGGGGIERSALASSSSSRATEGQGEGEDEGDVTIHPSHEPVSSTGAGATSTSTSTDEASAESRARREERLKDSLYELRGINDTFETFLYALESARGHNEVGQIPDLAHLAGKRHALTPTTAASSPGAGNFDSAKSVYSAAGSSGAHAETPVQPPLDRCRRREPSPFRFWVHCTHDLASAAEVYRT